ncbi:MAG: caspase family protein [Clostridiales bacterium]|nr:caspase family protein [Clostridiales bacterium]
MRRLSALLFALSFFLAAPAPVRGEVRALLVACRSFLTAPSLGYDSSANLQTLAACLTLAGVDGARLRLEDGTVSSPVALAEAAHEHFSGAAGADISLLYLCTHGFPDPYLLLSDGEEESILTPQALSRLLSSLPGKKLVILDACFSGAFLESEGSPFKANPEIAVLTSCSAGERSWYSAGEALTSGTLSYFVNTLCEGLGLHGGAEADTDGDGTVRLSELFSFLSEACVVSTPQLSRGADPMFALPTVPVPLSERALTDFSFGSRLLSPDDPTVFLSCTVRRSVSIQYRFVERRDGEWDWQAATFLAPQQAQTGRLSHSLRLRGAKPGDVFALQVYALEDGRFSLCASRLFTVSILDPADAGGEPVPPDNAETPRVSVSSHFHLSQ